MEFMPFVAKYPTDERNKKVSKLLKQDHHTSFFLEKRWKRGTVVYVDKIDHKL
jgi:hypothetical protein